MGLLGTSVKYGTIFLIAKQGVKKYEEHKQKKQTRQLEPLPIQPGEYVQPPFPQQQLGSPRSVSESFHQVWCNGRCGGKCNARNALFSVDPMMTPAQRQVDEKSPMY